MKKILTVVAVMISVGAMAQKKDSAKTIDNHISIPQYDTIYILNPAQVGLIKKVFDMQKEGLATVNPQTWDGLLNMMNQGMRMIPQQLPNKEQPKK